MKQQFFPQRLFMDMKRLIINRLVGLGLLVVGALVSCNAPTAFVPVPSPNPWMDDYTALSSMENYKQWGTYNVHDPACKKIGDTYYMYSTDAIFARYANQKIWYIGILWDGPFPKYLLRL